MISESDRRNLRDRGYTVLENFAPPALLAELRAAVDAISTHEGDKAGAEFRTEAGASRLANLAAKGEVFERLVLTPAVLTRVECVLGPRFKLSSLNARSANPHSDAAQPLHCDGGQLPDPTGAKVCNVIWMLDDFTPQNGATRCVPGSHTSGTLPQTVLANCEAQHPKEILCTGPAGTVVVMNAHMWHGGTANITDKPRRAIHAFYCRYDLPQQQYQKEMIPRHIQDAFSPDLRRLLALDDPLNDELCAAGTNMTGFLK